MTQTTDSDKKAYDRYMRGMKAADEQYDPEARMVRKPFSSPGYHTALESGFVHPTGDAMGYAVKCLDAGDDLHLRRAEGVLRRVISLQDQDPSSKTYGIWSWYLEEPLDKMGTPDWNWADFLGMNLLQALMYHSARLSDDVRRLAEQSLRHACESIIRRNVQPGYTNIAILGTSVTLVSGERMGWKDVEDYGLKRLRHFYDYTMERRSFDEYNSPIYTRLAVNELSRLLNDFRNPEAIPLVRELHELAWTHMARRFHAPTRQWAGPHSRCYATLQTADLIGWLQMASEGKLDFMPQDDVRPWPRQVVHMPESVVHFYGPIEEPRTETEVFAPAAADRPALVGTTYLHPSFTLGSISHSDLWNQRRSVVAYWGTPEKPSYLHLRFLHDGFDFGSAWVFAAQHEGNLLASVTMATDGGDTHPSLDKIKDGRIKSSDLRLRLEIGGAAAQSVQSREWNIAEPLRLELSGIYMTLQLPSASFGGKGGWGRVLGVQEASTVFHPRPGQKPDTSIAAVDIILDTGPERTIDLTKLQRTFVALALSIGTGDADLPWANVAVADELTLSWDLQSPLRLSSPIGPLPAGDLLRR